MPGIPAGRGAGAAFGAGEGLFRVAGAAICPGAAGGVPKRGGGGGTGLWDDGGGGGTG